MKVHSRYTFDHNLCRNQTHSLAIASTMQVARGVSYVGVGYRLCVALSHSSVTCGGVRVLCSTNDVPTGQGKHPTALLKHPLILEGWWLLSFLSKWLH